MNHNTTSAEYLV